MSLLPLAPLRLYFQLDRGGSAEHTGPRGGTARPVWRNPLLTWVMFLPQRRAQSVNRLAQQSRDVSKRLGLFIFYSCLIHALFLLLCLFDCSIFHKSSLLTSLPSHPALASRASVASLSLLPGRIFDDYWIIIQRIYRYLNDTLSSKPSTLYSCLISLLYLLWFQYRKPRHVARVRSF